MRKYWRRKYYKYTNKTSKNICKICNETIAPNNHSTENSKLHHITDHFLIDMLDYILTSICLLKCYGKNLITVFHEKQNFVSHITDLQLK